MAHILVINSSISGENSVSRLLVQETVERLIEAHPGAVVTHRDVGAAPVPHLTPESVAGVRAVAASEAELSAAALSDELIDELKKADIIVIGAPMYNFSIASGLRTWFDHVLRPRVTFAYSDTGPQGLITGKRVIVVESRGGLYTEGPAVVMDFQEPYLKTLLGFIGLTDVTFVHAEKLGFGPEARELALTIARGKIAATASHTAA
ncbi:FMN-dependent NADH-azoreductase [Neorhizobium galegae]|uniref:FMN dependent NADH:quinone oxidoreductase n=1 Tax=Neorhizobium galegae TaxID=399 RepID=A0A6A1TKP3_NEOGA|nr:FMN-dependent NADH-azoreductase [Neorhizobium galegae]KAB1085372.1 FMN-dependent NADH-azoreductase [Neorhizobium galegae]